MKPLAVIIPAYKSAFFDKALQSLSNQTNKNFTVYVGDDCSPEDMRGITEKYKSELEIHYTRFENNIGAKYLVHQWNRCIQLTKDEPWLWLFSDDDIADANCVETFYKTMAGDNNKFDVYRFDTRIINEHDNVLGDSPESPFVDSSYNMAVEILMGKRGNSMPDHIFSRNIIEKYKGFVYTDYAQAADWATSILFSSVKGICTMKGAKLNWRVSNQNISGTARRNRRNLLKGHLQFLTWVLNHFSYLGNGYEYERVRDASVWNLSHVVNMHYKGLSIFNFTDVYTFYKTVVNPLKAFRKTLRLYLHC
jgi:glycosyltransferase involved in cell wall biosynthesis